MLKSNDKHRKNVNGPEKWCKCIASEISSDILSQRARTNIRYSGYKFSKIVFTEHISQGSILPIK